MWDCSGLAACQQLWRASSDVHPLTLLNWTLQIQNSSGMWLKLFIDILQTKQQVRSLLIIVVDLLCLEIIQSFKKKPLETVKRIKKYVLVFFNVLQAGC